MRRPWIPGRLDWHPDEPTSNISCYIREAGSIDWPGVLALFDDAKRPRPSKRKLQVWTNEHRFVFRVAVRNARHVIGFCVTSHRNDESRIECVHTLSDYSTWNLLHKFFALAALELPERPLRMLVRHDDAWVEELSSNGWRAVAVVPDASGRDLYDMQFGPTVERRDLNSGGLDSKPPAPAAGVDQAGRDSGVGPESPGAVPTGP